MKINIVIKHLAIIFLLFVYSGVFAQTHSENFVITNVENGLVLEIEPTCNLKPGDTTAGDIACAVRLSPYAEGKELQLWKIQESKGYISLISLPFERYLKASQNLTIISRDNESFIFKPVATKAGNYLLLQVLADKDENGNPTLKFSYNCLQPVDGGNIAFRPFNENQEAIQSWKFVPIKAKTTDYLQDMNNQKLSKEWADGVSKDLMPHNNVADLIHQAKISKSKNDFDEALKLLQQAVQLEPDNDTANIELAGTYWAKKDFTQATLFAEKAKKLNPNNELTWNLLGLIARDQQQWEKAIPNFQTVVEINPRANISFANLGYCYEKIGNIQAAIENYTKSIDVTLQLGLKPESYMYNNRGLAYRKINKTNEAISDFRNALAIDPNNSTSKQNLDALLKMQQQDVNSTITLDARPTTTQQSTKSSTDPNDSKSTYYRTCRTCCGRGRVTIDGYYGQCPECEGTGKVLVGHIYSHTKNCE
jgi:tetratricopeptide (TPR) repeat protein